MRLRVLGVSPSLREPGASRMDPSRSGVVIRRRETFVRTYAAKGVTRARAVPASVHGMKPLLGCHPTCASRQGKSLCPALLMDGGRIARHGHLPEGGLPRVKSVTIKPPVGLDVHVQFRVSTVCAPP